MTHQLGLLRVRRELSRQRALQGLRLPLIAIWLLVILASAALAWRMTS